MNKKYNLKLDLQFRCNNSKMIFDEFDENTSDFFMQITRQGKEIDISNAIPTLLVLKPGGIAVSQILNVKDNLIYGNLNNSLKNEVGTYIAKLMLVEGDKKTFIGNISYEVTENALLGKIDDDIVEDERYSVLLQLLERLSNIELQEQTRVDNENSRIEAENLREESIEKIKNDIDFLINETNKKVNDNLNSNTSKIDNLVIDTKEELNEYKNNKDIAINEDLKEFKENTNKSIQDYKTSKDIEINNVLDTYKTNTTNDINSFKNTINNKIDKYKNDKDKAINEHIEAKELELDNYVEAKNKEIDEYKTSKNNELDLYVSEKDILIDSKISEVDVVKEQLQNSVNNKLIEVDNAEQIRQQEHEERQQFLDGFEGKLNTVVDDVATIKDDVVSVREANKRQDIFLQGLYNENLDGRVTIKEEGSVIALTNSADGLVDVVGLEGNTLVNYVQDGAKELTLNGDIDVEGTNVTLTEGVDNGLVDVACEGNTLVNLLDNKRFGGQHMRAMSYDEVTKTYSTTIDDYLFPSFMIRLNYPLDVSKTYTVIFKIKSSLNGKTFKYGLCKNNGSNAWNVTSSEYTLSNSYQTYIATLPKLGTDLSVLGFSFLRNSDSEFTGVEINIKDVVVLEGDWTNKEIPQYFEGMKSVGECEDNKIEILSRNKNIFDGIWSVGTINIDTGKENGDNAECRTDYIYIGGFTRLYKREFTDINLPYTYYKTRFYDINKNYIGTTDAWMNDSSYYTIPNGAKYLRLIPFKTNLEVMSNVRLVISNSEITDYIEHKLNKKEISLNEPLRGLSDNATKDKFIKIGGKWYVERNYSETVIGKENDYISVHGVVTYNDVSYVRFRFEIDEPINNIEVSTRKSLYGISNKFQIVQNGQANKPYSFGNKAHHVDGSSGKMIVYGVIDETITTVSLAREYFANNKVSLIYKLEKPTYEEITDTTLTTYLDATHISNNSIIPCNMKVTNTGYNTIIKPSTQYTVAFDTNKSGEVGINLAGSKVTTNNNVTTVTTPSTLTDDTLRLYGKGIKVNNVRLLEGDKTNYIPSFFEGMKSCFEDKLQEDGTYKMEILSNNKNLFNENILEKVNSNYYEIINKDNRRCLKIERPSLMHRTRILNQLKKNTSYKISFDMLYDRTKGDGLAQGGSIHIIYTDGTSNSCYASTSYNEWLNASIITPSNKTIRYIQFSYGANTPTYIDLDTFIIQENNNLVDYVYHKSNKIQFSSIEPLRGVGDVKDRFVFKDGKLMIERNIKEVVINNNYRLDELKGYEYNNTKLYEVHPTEELPVRTFGRENLKCNVLPTEVYLRDYELFSSWDGSNTGFMIRLNKHKINDIDKAKKWIDNNNVRIVYKLAEPTYEEVPYELQKIILEGYENGTLFFDTNIPPTVEANYTANIPLVSKVNEVNETTETNTEDIAITQMAVDFLLMSTLGEEMLDFKVRAGYNMASYFASRIIKGALKYEDVINKYPQYKEDINSILISEGHSDLIVEL